MLRPEYLEGLPDEILELFAEAEREILADMARRISTYDFWIPAADYQNEKLREAGVLQNDIIKALSHTTRKSEEELRTMMKEAGSMALHSDESIYKAAGLSVPSIKESQPLTSILNAGYRATATEMKNLCKTTAQTATKQFEDALDRAWLKVSSGAFDSEAAIRSAIKELSEKGVQSIRYPSGHTDSIETAVRRAIVTGVNQTAAKLQDELADELGCDLVEVTAHSGARPEHAEWQGQIYSRSGKHPNYPDFVASTGYGSGEGLCGWNCGHSYAPYFEGSPPVYSQEELDKLDEPVYEVDGKKLTEYEAKSKQRYNERQIRRWKLEEVALNAAGLDSSEAAAKVREWQARQADFLKQTGFKQDYAREQIQKNVFDVTKEYEKKAAPKTGSIFYDAGYKNNKHQEETDVANWLCEKYGGNIKLLNESEAFGIKMPDYEWNEKLWELKTLSTTKAADDAIRRGIKQIAANPGGIILDYKGNTYDLNMLQEIIKRRVLRCKINASIDVLIRSNGETDIILRYKK